MKTVRGTLVGFEEISEEAGLVNVTLRLSWHASDFAIQSGATYLVAFERAYERPPEIVIESAAAIKAADNL